MSTNSLKTVGEPGRTRTCNPLIKSRNNNVVDFLNGASFIVRPPPDALAEFKVQTGDYSAEFGHSAGAVVNASLKSGSNAMHGNLWEYFRNDALDARDWNAPTVAEQSSFLAWFENHNEALAIGPSMARGTESTTAATLAELLAWMS